MEATEAEAGKDVKQIENKTNPDKINKTTK